MKLQDVQSVVVSQISVDATLLAFGVPFAFSYADNEETVKAAITTRLLLSGVVIEVGLVSSADAGQSVQGRACALSAAFEVFVAENPTISHSPSALALVASVIAAVCKGLPSGEIVPICVGYDAAESKEGYTLHIMHFTVPVRIV